MRLNPRILRYGWLVVGSMFVACDDDTTGPGRRLTDTYVLQYVDGDPLPFTIEGQALLAEDLVFLSTGDVVRVRTMRRYRERGDTTVAVVTHYQYQVRGSGIGFFVECPPNYESAECLPGDQGTLTTDGLELQAFSLQFAEPPLLTYERRQ